MPMRLFSVHVNDIVSIEVCSKLFIGVFKSWISYCCIWCFVFS